jgi:hypothetical protein
MRFKEFLQLELDGMYGGVKSHGDLGLIHNSIKQAKPVKNKGTTVARTMSRMVSAPMPARPTSGIGYKNPQTIPSLLK